MPVSAKEYDDARPAALEMKWADGASLLAPGWSGVVTEVVPDKDRVIRDGEPVLAIDDVRRIAASTPRPFHRPLGFGAEGADVEMLNQLLARWAMPAGTGDSWDWETSEGIRLLGEKVGVDLSETPWREISFDPSWLIWLPTDAFPIQSIAASVGAMAPAQGSAVVNGRAILTSASVDAGAGVTAEEGFVIELQGQEFEFSGDATAPFADPSAVAAVLDGKPAQANGTLRRAEPISAWSVPPSAVMAARDGTYCVGFRAEKSSGAPRIVEITVLGGAIGETRVAGEFGESRSILANPSEVLDAPCVSN
ncbi:hypothetical protein [Agromyces sp. NPDC058126]|uniref:hypothetical protein n=1 Tax=Agromyces sp. NPDC058126 TaxID=3346350 RepID=UPI0036D9A9E3